MQDLLRSLNERPIAYYPLYRRLTGSTTAGILLSQLMYWFSKKDKIYKTDAEIMQETLLTDNELKTAKKKIKAVSFVSVTREGVPAKTYYAIDWKAYEKTVRDIAEQLAQTRLVESTKLDGSNPPNKKGRNDQTITETTAETTTDSDVADAPASSPDGSDATDKKPSSGTNAEGGGRADSQKCDYQKREPTERGYNPKLQLSWDIHEIRGKIVHNDAEIALELSRWLIDHTSKALDRKLTSKPESTSIVKLFKAGATPEDIKRAVLWLTKENLRNEFRFDVHSARALCEKWDRIQSSIKRTKPTAQPDWPKMLTVDDINKQIERTG